MDELSLKYELTRIRSLVFALLLVALMGCSAETVPSNDVTSADVSEADVILTNARVYTLSWEEPSLEGEISSDAPLDERGWRPDAEAVVIQDGIIRFVGSTSDAMKLSGDSTRVIDLDGATVIPGLVDSHTHIFGLGALLDKVNLIDVPDAATAVDLVRRRAQSTPKGEWIIGRGWDEGAWANDYPDKRELSAAVPDHPVLLRGRHGFAVWVNEKALELAGVTASSVVPVGGEMQLGEDGSPSGLFMNRAVTMFDSVLPVPTRATLRRHARLGLEQMAKDGYTAIHDAGLDSMQMFTLEAMEAEGELPIRVYAMLSLRDEPLIRRWLKKGPDSDADSMLVTRTVKAYYDGALGSRGARLLADYSDMAGHRGVSGGNYGFDEALNAEAMRAGFQIAIHAIGDAGNREAIDILEAVFRDYPETIANRHRIEHAQVLADSDIPRLQQYDMIASMEPPHAMEDKAWAEERLGSTRILGAYAWRTLREAGARLTFNSDNPGSDHSIFYGLHSAITRQDANLLPEGGWYPEQRMTVDEAIRAYTSWSAHASFRESQTGYIEVGQWADITAMDVDPFVLAGNSPEKILAGQIVLTMVDGDVVYELN
ncbi:MAG: amidohydrolase [Pseudomonadota bacterium]